MTLLFVVLVISLNQDETWALPRLSDQILTEADLEEIIDQYLDSLTITRIVPVCDCAGHQVTILEAFVEAEEWTPRRTIFANQCDCASGQRVEWICGTMLDRAVGQIREARKAGLHPWAIAQLVEQYCGAVGTCKLGLRDASSKPPR